MNNNGLLTGKDTIPHREKNMTKQTQLLLILDDDNAVRESFVYFFEDRGWKVMSANNAEVALELVTDNIPDGAIVDIRLPGMDGNSFIYAMNKTHPNVACVICTGSPEYHLPSNISILPQVSDKVFDKPVEDIGELEDELLSLIQKCKDKMEVSRRFGSENS